MIRAVVFDLDDTLMAEHDYFLSGIETVADLMAELYDLNRNEVLRRMIHFFEEDSSFVFNRTLDSFQVHYTTQQIQEFIKSFREHQPDIAFFDDVIPCLEYLKKQGMRLGLITDGYKESQLEKVKALDATRWFDEIIVTDELGREHWKPDPLSFDLIAERFAMQLHEIVYIGDNPQKDFYIRAMRSILTIRLNRGGIYQHRSYLKDIEPHEEIANLEQLPAVINRWKDKEIHQI